MTKEEFINKYALDWIGIHLKSQEPCQTEINRELIGISKFFYIMGISHMSFELGLSSETANEICNKIKQIRQQQ